MVFYLKNKGCSYKKWRIWVLSKVSEGFWQSFGGLDRTLAQEEELSGLKVPRLTLDGLLLPKGRGLFI